MIELFLLSLPFAMIGGLILLNRWQWAILPVMPLMLYEGALRKWVFPAFQAQIYFIKDALVLIAMAGFFIAVYRRGVHEHYLRRMTILLFASLVYFTIQVGNPNSPTPMVGLLGLKAYMLYTVLLIMVPYLFTSRDDLDRKLKIFMLIMIPIALLGMVQFSLPPTHWINAYVLQDARDEMIISQFGEDNRARAAGTFSYIGGFGTFVVASFNMALAYVLVARNGVWKNWIPYLLLASSTMAIFTTGSRWVLLGTFGTAPLVFLLLMRAGQLSPMFFVRLAGASLLLVIVISTFAEQAFEAMNHRANNADSAAKRFLSPIIEMLAAFETSPFFGTGIGTNSNGSWVLAGVRSPFEAPYLHGHVYEVETARVMQEVGPIGFFLVFALRIILLIWAIRMVTLLRTPLYKSLAAAIAAFFVLHVVMFVIHNPTAGLFYWFAAGLLFAMYRMDHEDAPPRAQYAPPPRYGKHSSIAPLFGPFIIGWAALNRYSVWISHPERQHSHQFAMAMAEKNQLASYLHGAPIPPEAMQIIPISVRKKVGYWRYGRVLINACFPAGLAEEFYYRMLWTFDFFMSRAYLLNKQRL